MVNMRLKFALSQPLLRLSCPEGYGRVIKKRPKLNVRSAFESLSDPGWLPKDAFKDRVDMFHVIFVIKHAANLILRQFRCDVLVFQKQV